MATSREEQLFTRLAAAEARLAALESSISASAPGIVSGREKVRRSMLSRGVFNHRLVKVPADYYDRPLSERAVLLNAQMPQLCKSIIFENVNFDASLQEGENDQTYSRFYLVVLQYEAKFDALKLESLICNLRPIGRRLPKSKFNFRLAAERDSFLLSGYEHNAVTPFGMTLEHGAVKTEAGPELINSIPIVLCSRILDVTPAFIYLGGGEVDVKLGLSLDDFMRTCKPIVGSVSEGR